MPVQSETVRTRGSKPMSAQRVDRVSRRDVHKVAATQATQAIATQAAPFSSTFGTNQCALEHLFEGFGLRTREARVR